MSRCMILKVERRVDEPDIDYYKYVNNTFIYILNNFNYFQIANWTLENGIVPLYSNLGVDLTSLNHFRIVTTIVRWQIVFKCIHLK